MSIDRQESEGFEATSTTPTPDDLSNVDRGDDRPSLDRWSPIESRIGWPGRLFKRSLRRLMRFSLATQADFNERLIAKTDALALQLSVGDAENSQSIASLETRLRTRIEALERSFEETVEPRLDRLEERARLTDKDWREAASDLDNRLDSTLQRVEAIEHHSIAFQSDVTGDFRNVRVTATTQGRQIDDIAGQLLAHVHSLPELEARLRATLEAQPTPREVLSAEIASIHQLHADHIAICEETASTREQLTTAQNELNVLREGVDGLTKTQQRQAASEARLDEVTQDLGTRTNTIGSTLDEITAEIRTRAETFERTLGAVQKGGVERLEVLNIRLENIESAVAGAHERVATSQESEAAARGVIADALVSITSEARGRLDVLNIRLENIESAVADAHERVATSQESEAAARGVIADALVSITSEARGSAEQADVRLAQLERRALPPTGLVHYDFNQTFRGDEQDISSRLTPYIDRFRGLSKVLDVGCGRGEFLSLCRENDIGVVGVDSDPDMVGHCRLQGTEVVQADLFDHLRSLPDRGLDGIFSAQVIEHLSPIEICELLDLAAQKLRRGAPVLLETINPGTWSAMRWFYLDPTHSQPVPPGMLQYLLEQYGFDVDEIVYGPAAPDEERLLLPDLSEAEADDPNAELLQLLHRNWSRVNEALFGAQDYAIVATR